MVAGSITCAPWSALLGPATVEVGVATAAADVARGALEGSESSAAAADEACPGGGT